MKLFFLIETAGAQLKAVKGLVDSLPKALARLNRADLAGVGTVFPGYKIFLEPTAKREAVPKAFQQVSEEQQAYVQAENAKDKRQRPVFSFEDLTNAVSEISRKETDPSGRTRLVIVLITDDFDLLNPKRSAEASRELLRNGTLLSAFIDVENVGISIAKRNVHAMEMITPMRLSVRDHGASYFADQTGGPIIQVENGDYPAALERLLRQLSGSYLIGFEPSSSELDGKFHKIKVALTRADLRKTNRLFCRLGFWAYPN